jgi:hypothetical protein
MFVNIYIYFLFDFFYIHVGAIVLVYNELLEILYFIWYHLNFVSGLPCYGLVLHVLKEAHYTLTQ